LSLGAFRPKMVFISGLSFAILSMNLELSNQ
jgi:hypothetical protein